MEPPTVESEHVKETARELLRRNCVVCHTGIGVWNETSFLNHADKPNATRLPYGGGFK